VILVYFHKIQSTTSLALIIYSLDIIDQKGSINKQLKD